VDRVVPGQLAVGSKLVTAGEANLTGHFPGAPLLPGVLIVEALAQLAGVAAADSGTIEGRLAAVHEFRFRRPVLPGDRLMLSVEVVRRIGHVVRVRGVASVGDEVAADGELTITIGPST